MAGRRLRGRRERQLRLGVETCDRAAGKTGVAVTVIHRVRDRELFLDATRKLQRVLPVEDLADAAVWSNEAGCIRALSGTVDFSICGRRAGRPLDFTTLRSLVLRAITRLP